MSMDKDKILLRAKDIALLVSILILAGLLLNPIRKTFEWDMAVKKVEALEDKVSANSTALAITRSQYDEIIKNLEKINRRLDRMNRRSERDE